MGRETVLFFDPFPLEVGQKLHINAGPRKGDWEVIGVSEKKVKLRCPVSLREFEWDRFFYFADERNEIQWPQKE